MSNSSSGLQLSDLSWTIPACSCGAVECSVCRGQSDPHIAIRHEVTEHFVAFREGVYRYLRHRGLAPQDAEDITQETFLRLYRARLNGRHVKPEHLRPWTIMVARRLAIDRQRRQRTEQPLFLELSGNLADTLPDGGQDSEDALRERQRRAALMRGIQELTILQRTCLHFRAEGLSLRDTSAKVGISERRVSDAVHRGIRRLKKLIDALT